MAESGDRPGVEVGEDQVAANFCGDECVEHELCTRTMIRQILYVGEFSFLLGLDGIESTSRKELIEIIVKSRYVLLRNDSHLTSEW